LPGGESIGRNHGIAFGRECSSVRLPATIEEIEEISAGPEKHRAAREERQKLCPRKVRLRAEGRLLIFVPINRQTAGNRPSEYRSAKYRAAAGLSRTAIE
jgi:hypothetical protein